MTSPRCHSAKVLSTPVRNSIVAIVTELGRYLIFNSRRSWHTVYAMLLSNYRGGSSIVDKTLYFQSRDRKVDPPLLRSFRWDFKPRYRLCMTSLLVGRKTRVHSTTQIKSQLLSEIHTTEKCYFLKSLILFSNNLILCWRCIHQYFFILLNPFGHFVFMTNKFYQQKLIIFMSHVYIYNVLIM